MTPEDVADLRADMAGCGLSDEDVLALCDALEAAWAALVDLQAWADHESDRAERAEAELALCRGCQTALARVRHLCDNEHLWAYNDELRDRIRAAIEGDNQ